MIKSGLRCKNRQLCQAVRSKYRQMQRTNQKLVLGHVTACSCSVICSIKRKEDEYCVGVVYVYSIKTLS